MLILAANRKGVCRLENWALLRKGLLWVYEESEMCATDTQSFCARKAKTVVIVYYIGVNIAKDWYLSNTSAASVSTKSALTGSMEVDFLWDWRHQSISHTQ